MMMMLAKILCFLVIPHFIFGGIIIDLSKIPALRASTPTTTVATTTPSPILSTTSIYWKTNVERPSSTTSSSSNWLDIIYMIFAIPRDIIIALAAVVTLSLFARQMYFYFKKKCCNRLSSASASASASAPISVVNHNAESNSTLRRFCLRNGCHK